MEKDIIKMVNQNLKSNMEKDMSTNIKNGIFEGEYLKGKIGNGKGYNQI